MAIIYNPDGSTTSTGQDAAGGSSSTPVTKPPPVRLPDDFPSSLKDPIFSKAPTSGGSSIPSNAGSPGTVSGVMISSTGGAVYYGSSYPVSSPMPSDTKPAIFLQGSKPFSMQSIGGSISNTPPSQQPPVFTTTTSNTPMAGPPDQSSLDPGAAVVSGTTTSEYGVVMNIIGSGSQQGYIIPYTGAMTPSRPELPGFPGQYKNALTPQYQDAFQFAPGLAGAPGVKEKLERSIKASGAEIEYVDGGKGFRINPPVQTTKIVASRDESGKIVETTVPITRPPTTDTVPVIGSTSNMAGIYDKNFSSYKTNMFGVPVSGTPIPASGTPLTEAEGVSAYDKAGGYGGMSMIGGGSSFFLPDASGKTKNQAARQEYEDKIRSGEVESVAGFQTTTGEYRYLKTDPNPIKEEYRYHKTDSNPTKLEGGSTPDIHPYELQLYDKLEGAILPSLMMMHNPQAMSHLFAEGAMQGKGPVEVVMEQRSKTESGMVKILDYMGTNVIIREQEAVNEGRSPQIAAASEVLWGPIALGADAYFTWQLRAAAVGGAAKLATEGTKALAKEGAIGAAKAIGKTALDQAVHVARYPVQTALDLVPTTVKGAKQAISATAQTKSMIGNTAATINLLSMGASLAGDKGVVGSYGRGWIDTSGKVARYVVGASKPGEREDVVVGMAIWNLPYYGLKMVQAGLPSGTASNVVEGVYKGMNVAATGVLTYRGIGEVATEKGEAQYIQENGEDYKIPILGLKLYDVGKMSPTTIAQGVGRGFGEVAIVDVMAEQYSIDKAWEGSSIYKAAEHSTSKLLTSGAKNPAAHSTQWSGIDIGSSKADLSKKPAPSKETPVSYAKGKINIDPSAGRMNIDVDTPVSYTGARGKINFDPSAGRMNIDVDTHKLDIRLDTRTDIGKPRNRIDTPTDFKIDKPGRDDFRIDDPTKTDVPPPKIEPPKIEPPGEPDIYLDLGNRTDIRVDVKSADVKVDTRLDLGPTVLFPPVGLFGGGLGSGGNTVSSRMARVPGSVLDMLSVEMGSKSILGTRTGTKPQMSITTSRVATPGKPAGRPRVSYIKPQSDKPVVRSKGTLIRMQKAPKEFNANPPIKTNGYGAFNIWPAKKR